MLTFYLKNIETVNFLRNHNLYMNFIIETTNGQ